MAREFKKIILLSLSFLVYWIGRVEAQYKDILVSNNIVWALTSQGTIRLFDATNANEIKNNVSADTGIILINHDKAGNIVTANKRKEIKKYDQNKKVWEVIAKYNAEPFSILFNSRGSCFSITAKGIQDLTIRKLFFSNKSANNQLRLKDQWGKPYCTYIDQNDIIWLGFGYGEWGGNLIAFDSNKKIFLDLSHVDFEISLSPIKSFFEDSTSLYISAGLDHMTTSGSIIKLNNLKAEAVYKSESHWVDPEKRDSMIYGEYIGPATFNPYNNSIYFYSQNGIFIGDKSKDLSKSENWKKVVSPELNWTNGQPDAVGSPMNVLKLCIVDNTKLVFLSQHNGIGFYDGQKLIMK